MSKRRCNRKRRGRSQHFEFLERRDLLTTLVDVDLDGDLDAVFEYAWYENDDASFWKHPYSADTPQKFLLADVTADETLDFIGGKGEWIDGTSSTASPWGPIRSADLPHWLIDYDDDGWLDLIARQGGTLFVSQGNGEGFDGVNRKSIPTETISIPSEFDGNQMIDAVYVHRTSGANCPDLCDTVSMRPNLRQNERIELLVIKDGATVRHLEILDYDIDGDRDVIVETNKGWHTLLNQDGMLIESGFTASQAERITWSDLDQDGDFEAVEFLADNRIRWNYTEGHGGRTGSIETGPVNFSASDRHGLITAESIIDIGDIDGDGMIDFIVNEIARTAPIWISGNNLSLQLPSVPIRPGDSNGDDAFDSTDLIMVFEAGEYEDGVPNNSDFSEGDWNQDGDFDTTDLVVAFEAGRYEINAHPRLLFDLSEIRTVRENVKSKKYAYKLRYEKANALRLLSTDYRDSTLYEERKARQAAQLAFVVLMLDEDDPDRAPLAAKAREAMAHINDGLWSSTLVHPRHRAGWDGSDLNQWYGGSVLMEYSLAYDWLVGAGELKGIARDDARFRILRLAQIEHEIHSTQANKLDRGKYYLRNANKRFRSLAGVGMVALTFPEQEGLIDDPLKHMHPSDAKPFSSQAALEFVMGELFEDITIERPRNITDQSMISHYVSTDGVYAESLSYQNDAFYVTIPFLAAYHRIKDVDYLSEQGVTDGRISKMYANNAKLMVPDGTRPNIGDCWAGYNYYHHEIIANYSDRETNYWYFEDHIRSTARLLGISAKWLRTDTTPLPEPNYRTEFLPDAGLAVFRDRWGPEATYLALVARHRPTRGHNQADQGSIMLYAHGSYLIVDPGYGSAYGRGPNERGVGGRRNWMNSALGHSGVTLDSIYRVEDTPSIELRKHIHPRADTQSYNDALDPAYLKNTLTSDSIDYAEAHVIYEEKEAELLRGVAFPRHRYFVLDDRLTANDTHTYGWQLHLSKTETGNLSGEPHQLTWTTSNEQQEQVALGIQMLDQRRNVNSYDDGPTNYDGLSYPEAVYDHTYLIADETAKDTQYLTLLDPYKVADGPLQVETVAEGRVWKIVHSPTEYDLLMSQPKRASIAFDRIRTDATFLIASIDVVDGQHTLKSVLAKHGTQIRVDYDVRKDFTITDHTIFHREF
ncbi:MAG: hypothetical protein CMJ77_09265 [Planctomycetaceae bacterium]|nr:hypothetical protein [Planctomycetaceae bacterium]